MPLQTIVENKRPLSYTAFNIDELLSHIDIKYCDSYDSWFRIGAALFNSGFDQDVFDVFSKRSHEFCYASVNSLWASLERNAMESIQFPIIMYYLKMSDMTYFRGIRGKFKSEIQLTETGGIYQKKCKDAEVLLAKEMKIYMQDW